MKHKVVVIGHGYTSRLAIIRSVGMAGYDVDVVVIYYGNRRPRKRPLDCYSKYVDCVLYSPSGDETNLVSLLINNYQNCFDKPILIPESDFAVRAIDNNLHRLSGLFLVPNIGFKEGAVVEWMDKEKQKERAVSVGLAVASCNRIPIRNGDFTIPGNISYPCFPKPADGGKKGLGRCDNMGDLYRSLKTIGAARDVDVLIEDFLHIDKEYALVGFSDGHNVVIPAVLYIEQMAHGGHYGVAKRGLVLGVTGFESLIAKFKQLVQSIGFVGLFDIDFLECNGVFFFDEINLRFGGSGYAVTKAGCNLPAMMVDFLTRKDYDRSVQMTVPQSFVNERTCLDDWYYNFITFKDFLTTVHQSSICFVKDEEDMSPYRAYSYYLLYKRIKHFINYIIH